MVQIRSLVNHEPLPGITLGDIGPKLGYNSMDNGFAYFDQVRIPIADMLGGFAYITDEGDYYRKDGNISSNESPY